VTHGINQKLKQMKLVVHKHMLAKQQDMALLKTSMGNHWGICFSRYNGSSSAVATNFLHSILDNLIK